MALVQADRVLELTSTTGTGAVTLTGAPDSYQTFLAGIGDGNTVYYTIADNAGTDWEVGLGTYTASGNTLSRDTVFASSNSGSLVPFTSGVKQVFVTYPAEKSALQGSPATFTTLTATGQANLGGDGATNSQSFRAYLYGGNAFIGVRGHTLTGVAPFIFSGSSTQSNVNLGIGTQGTGAIQFATGGGLSSSGLFNQIDQFRVAHTASAVNYVQVTGAATGGRPIVSAQGSDSNISIGYDAKGTGGHNFKAGGNTQVLINNAASAVNALNFTGSATNNEPTISVSGTDTNISLAFQSKGTGAIDLAAGSSGVNISNGGTVTAITRTATGSGYTSPPTWTASAPTTAGGTTASGTTTLTIVGGTLSSGGSGYTVGDVLTVSGGTSSQAAIITVNTVSAGAVATYTVTTAGNYSVLPTNPVSVTGGTGSGATFNLIWGITSSGLVITNAGSGYVEQPTVTFSGGGGSGAAAYATVGSATVIKSLGVSTSLQSLDFATPGGTQVRVQDVGDGTRPLHLNGGSSGGVSSAGIGSALGALQLSSNANNISFYSGGRGATQQFNVSHTASAVNYVQVTGSVTNAGASALGGLFMNGSDATTSMAIGVKNGGYIHFYNGSPSNIALRVDTTGANSTGNMVVIKGAAAGSAPAVQASSGTSGTDTNIDLALTPKGTGVVRAGGNYVNYLNLSGATTGNAPTISSAGSDASVGLAFATKNGSGVTFDTGSSSLAKALTLAGVGSGVAVYNGFTMTPTASGGIPAFAATGSNTDISMNVYTKGAGYFAFRTQAGSATQLFIKNTTSAVNRMELAGSATGSPIVMNAAGSDTDVGIDITPKGYGGKVRMITDNGYNLATASVLNAIGGGSNHIELVANYDYSSTRSAAVKVNPYPSYQDADLELVPANAGYVKYGTYSSTFSPTITGYITIRDSSGTLRKLAVIA